MDTRSKDSLTKTRVAAFDTSIETWKPLMLMTAPHGLLRKLRSLGGKRIARPQTFLVERSTKEGPEGKESRQDLLRDGELARARAWGSELLTEANGRLRPV